MNLKIKFPNGDVFLVAAEVVAEQRTSYYADVDGFEKGSPEWEEEFKQSMRPDEILDWVQNNMDWIDVKSHAVKQTETKIDYDKMWSESDFTVI